MDNRKKIFFPRFAGKHLKIILDINKPDAKNAVRPWRISIAVDQTSLKLCRGNEDGM
jgi:hypothetical protein